MGNFHLWPNHPQTLGPALEVEEELPVACVSVDGSVRPAHILGSAQLQ